MDNKTSIDLDDFTLNELTIYYQNNNDKEEQRQELEKKPELEEKSEPKSSYVCNVVRRCENGFFDLFDGSGYNYELFENSGECETCGGKIESFYQGNNIWNNFIDKLTNIGKSFGISGGMQQQCTCLIPIPKQNTNNTDVLSKALFLIGIGSLFLIVAQ